MGAIRRVRRVGTSLTLTIPADVAAAMDLRPGERMEWHVERRGVLTVRRVKAEPPAAGPPRDGPQ